MSAIPISRPNIGSRPKRRTSARAGTQTWDQVLKGAAAFVAIALVSFGTFSLFGHVMVEQARRDGIRANQRLRVAVAAQSSINRQIESLSNEHDLVLWAKRNGFVAPDKAAKPSGDHRVLVAAR